MGHLTRRHRPKRQEKLVDGSNSHRGERGPLWQIELPYEKLLKKILCKDHRWLLNGRRMNFLREFLLRNTSKNELYKAICIQVSNVHCKSHYRSSLSFV